jgi:hypothetical protein
MKTVVALLSVALALVAVLPASADEQPARDVAAIQMLAPADSYFGRLRMSVLGVKNAIRDIADRIDIASEDQLAVLYHKLTMVEDSVVDLKERYPQDTWLPRFGLELARAFARMPYPLAQIKANDDLDWVIAEYPTSREAQGADAMRRARLAPPLTMDVPIEPEIDENTPRPVPTIPSYARPL